MSEPNGALIAKMCVILDRCSPGWHEIADPDTAPEGWASEIYRRRVREVKSKRSPCCRNPEVV